MQEIRRPSLASVSRNLGKIRSIGSVGEETQIKTANIYETFEDAKNVNLYFYF